MKLETFVKLLKLAQKIGIKTAGELVAYKKEKNAKTNDDLYLALLFDAYVAD